MWPTAAPLATASAEIAVHVEAPADAGLGAIRPREHAVGPPDLDVTSARLCRSSSVSLAEAWRVTCTWPPRTSSPRSTPSTYWETLERLSATAWSETARVRAELSRIPPAATMHALASRKTRSSVTERSVAVRRLEPVPASSFTVRIRYRIQSPRA